MRVYASFGGVNLGKRGMHMDVGRVWPAEFSTIDMMTVVQVSGSVSINHVVANFLLPRFLPLGAIGNSVVGGQSLGCCVAHSSALQLESCFEGVRACFWLDARSIAPRASLNRESLAAVRENVNAAMARQGITAVRRVVSLLEAPRLRPDANFLDIRCQFGGHQSALFQSDEAMEARRYFYMRAGDFELLPDTDHMVMSSECYWDIARRLRRVVVRPSN